MIELTDEMVAAFEEAAGGAPANTCAWDFGNNRAGLAAVLAIVERDYDALLTEILELLDSEPNHKVRDYIRIAIKRYRDGAP